MQRTALLNPTAPAVEADAAGIFHVFPIPIDEHPELDHELNFFCWCFPEPRWLDEKGKRMAQPVYTHHVFAMRGNS